MTDERLKGQLRELIARVKAVRPKWYKSSGGKRRSTQSAVIAIDYWARMENYADELQAELSTTTADKVFDILVSEAGASEYWRDNFVASFDQPDMREYRFQGLLGFGGKFRMRHGGEWRVDNYPEDQSAERDEIISRTNERLDKLYAETKGKV